MFAVFFGRGVQSLRNSTHVFMSFSHPFPWLSEPPSSVFPISPSFWKECFSFVASPLPLASPSYPVCFRVSCFRHVVLFYYFFVDAFFSRSVDYLRFSLDSTAVLSTLCLNLTPTVRMCLDKILKRMVRLHMEETGENRFEVDWSVMMWIRREMKPAGRSPTSRKRDIKTLSNNEKEEEEKKRQKICLKSGLF